MAKTHVVAVFALFLLCACTSRPGVSSEPPSGIWSGNYETSPGRPESISVQLRWEDTNLRGFVRSGFRSIPITKASFDRNSGAITIEFDTEGSGGRTVHYVVDGTVDGGTMTGTWTHDGQRGTFRVTKE